MPMPDSRVEFEQFIRSPGQINVALRGGRIVGIGHNIGELPRQLVGLPVCIEGHFVVLKSRWRFLYDALEPLDDEPFGLLNPIQ